VSVTTADIKQLREMTGAGILDCKKALNESGGDVDQAVEYLRKKGLAAAAKKTSREANDGLVEAAVSQDGQIGAMVEINCETDFVARTENFKSFVNSVTRQVLTQEINSVEALLAAPFMDNPSNTIADQVTETIAKLGENIQVRHLARFVRQGPGLIDSYIHFGGRVGVLVEVGGGEANKGQLGELAHDLALHIAAASPRYLSEADIPAEALAAEQEIFRAQLASENKPDNIKERIIEGKIKKWYSEVTLLNQEFVKDPDLTISQLLEKAGRNLGQISVRRFARFELGAG
jgi:elongation factor Ts